MPEIKVVISAENKQALEAIQQVLMASKSASQGVDAVGGSGNGVKVAKDTVMSLSAALKQITTSANKASEAIERAGKNISDSMNKGAVGAKNLNNALGKTVSAAKATTAAIKETGTGTSSALGGAANKANLLSAALGRVAVASKGAGTSATASFAAGEASTGSFLMSLGKVTAVIAAVTAGLYTMKELLAPGFKYTLDMDSAKLGIAGTLQAMTKLNGEAVDFGTAMNISSGIMKQLQRDAALTAATTEDLVKVFQSIMAPGIAAGMSLDEIRQLTTTGAAAVKAIMPGNADAQRQMVQEIRDLVQGGIQASSSTLATALGITDADVDRAKRSSEGLFKFLMDRLKGYNDAALHYTDELPGKIDVLKETATRASAAFTEEFKDELKDLLDWVTLLFGTIDKESGDFTFSENMQAVFSEVKSDYKELKEFFEDESKQMEGSIDNVTHGAKDLWQSIKNVGSILADMARISGPVFDFFSQGFRDLMNDVKELTGYLKEAWDWWAKVAGVKKDKTTSPEGRSPADVLREDDSNKLPSVVDTTNLKAKFADNKKAVENSQAAMKESIDGVNEWAKQQTTIVKGLMKELEVANSQSPVSDFYKKMADFEIQLKQIEVTKAENILGVTQEAMFDKDTSKEAAVTKAQNDLNTATTTLTETMKSLNDVTSATIGNVSALPEQGGMEDRGLANTDPNTRNLAYMVGNWLKSSFGMNPEVTSGWRSPENNATSGGVANSWHLQGKAVDINVGEIDDALAAQIKEYAQQYFDEVLYHDVGSGLHLHLGNPKEGAAAFESQVKTQFGAMKTDLGLKMYKEYMEMAKEVDGLVKDILESKGDYTSGAKNEVEVKYNDLINKYMVKNSPDWAAIATKAKAMKLREIDFTQLQNDLNLANTELADQERILMQQVTSGSKTAGDAVKEQVQLVDALLGVKVAELQKKIKEFTESGDYVRAYQAQDELNKIQATASAFLEKILSQIVKKLQDASDEISVDPRYTSFERDEMINAKKRETYSGNISAAQELINGIKDGSRSGTAADVANAEHVIRYNEALLKTTDTLWQMREAGRQAFADALYNWMTEGIQKCQTLGQAFREMAISILQEINKIMAKKVVTNIMTKMGFAGGGYVAGPGTGTSDSVPIDASHGEYVMKARAVDHFGVGFFNMLNNLVMPPRMAFADGGYVDLGGGASEAAASFAAGDQNVKIINVTDPEEVGKFFHSSAGEKVFVNMVHKHAGMIRNLVRK